MSEPVFTGTTEQQQLAQEIFQIMKFQGGFFGADAPIRQTLKNLADFLSEKHRRDRMAMEMEIETAIQENTQVFQREEIDNEVFYITSRTGTYQTPPKDTLHSFKQRFYEPEKPLPVDDISVVVSTSRPALTAVEPVFISDYWQEQAEYASVPSGRQKHGAFASYAEQDESDAADRGSYDEDSLLSEETAMPAHAVDTDFPYGDEQGGGRSAGVFSESGQEGTASTFEEADRVPTDEAVYGDAAPSSRGAAFVQDRSVPSLERQADMLVQEPSALSDEQASVAQDELAAGFEESSEGAGSGGAAQQVAADIIEQRETRSPSIFLLSDGTAVDIGLPIDTLLARHRDSLEQSLVHALEQDPLRRIVHFGRSFYPEASIVSLGKNDLRRIRDYILEVGEPLLDTSIIADLYYHNPRNADYEGFRFSLNYRLSREKDFEFVGVEGANLWSTKGLATIGTKRVKAGEMGQITAYLTEAYDDSLQEQSAADIREAGQIDRLLSFFEWQYGVLPLDQSFATLLPRPMLLDQRSAVLRIESPQHYTNFLVEVRYSTGNRGGWLQGFEDFFHEHLVAGALITLSRTDEPNVFTIAYEEVPVTRDRLLTLDEKKNKLTFSDVSYYCMVDEDRSINQQRFGKAKNLKSLPMSERRKADVVLEHVFETMGERIGTREEPQYRMSLQDLSIAYNILRPASVSYLISLLNDNENFSPDETLPDTYCYRPEPEEDQEEDKEDEDTVVEKRPGRRWSYDYDDDE